MMTLCILVALLTAMQVIGFMSLNEAYTRELTGEVWTRLGVGISAVVVAVVSFGIQKLLEVAETTGMGLHDHAAFSTQIWLTAIAGAIGVWCSYNYPSLVIWPFRKSALFLKAVWKLL